MGLQLPHRGPDRQNLFVIPDKDISRQHIPRHSALVWSICIHFVAIVLLSLFGWGARQTGSPVLRPAQIVLVRAEDTLIELDSKLLNSDLFDSDERDSHSFDLESARFDLDRPSVITPSDGSFDLPPPIVEPPTMELGLGNSQLAARDSIPTNASPIVQWNQYDAHQALSVSKGGGTSGSGSARSNQSAGIDPQRLAEEQEWVASRAPQGEPTTIDFMGIKALEGSSFVFLIDRSQSMQGEGVDLIRETRDHLQRAIGELQEQHQFQIAFYNDRVTTLSAPRLIPANDTNKDRIDSYLRQMISVGGTNHVGGIFSALAFQPDVIILLSDGGDPPLTAPQLHSIRSANQKPSQIHCLHFGMAINRPTPENNFMSQLAEENHGSYRYVSVGK